MRNFKVIMSNCFSPHTSYHQVRFSPITQLLFFIYFIFYIDKTLHRSFISVVFLILYNFMLLCLADLDGKDTNNSGGCYTAFKCAFFRPYPTLESLYDNMAYLPLTLPVIYSLHTNHDLSKIQTWLLPCWKFFQFSSLKDKNLAVLSDIKASYDYLCRYLVVTLNPMYPQIYTWWFSYIQLFAASETCLCICYSLSQESCLAAGKYFPVLQDSDQV